MCYKLILHGKSSLSYVSCLLKREEIEFVKINIIKKMNLMIFLTNI